MVYANNCYIGFVQELDLDQLSDLSDAMTCAGREGTPLEGIVSRATIQGRVDVIPRGRNQVLLYDRYSKTRVWVNRSTSSERAFLNALDTEIRSRIEPFSDIASYYAHQAALNSDD